MKTFLRKTACILMTLSIILSSSFPAFALEDLAETLEPSPAEQATETDGTTAFETMKTVSFSAADSKADKEDGIQAAPSADTVSESYAEIKIDIDEKALPDSEELLRMRIEKGLGETRNAAAESGFVPLRFSAKKTKALPSGAASYIYSTLQTEISKIARGTRTNTAIEVVLDSYDIKYYSSDLGGIDLFSGSFPTEAAKLAAMEKFENDNASFMTIISMLMADNPYDLYWFNKISNDTKVGVGFHYSTGDGWIGIGVLNFYMAVSDDYRGSNSVESYTTDSAQIGRAMGVVTEIEKVISDNATGTDLQKINAYVKYIEDNTEYNGAAAEAGGPYGDPWQLIFAFDKTDSTDIVCEGYSKAFKYLCDLSTFSDPTVEARTVCGTLDGGDHMWNVMTIGGKNYLVDITNCDGAGSIGYGNKLILRGMEKEDDYTYKTQLGSTYHVYKYDEDGAKTVDQFSVYESSELAISPTGYAEASLDCPDGVTYYSDHEDVVVTPSMVCATLAPEENNYYYDWNNGYVHLGGDSTYTIKPGAESPGEYVLYVSMGYLYDGCSYCGEAQAYYRIIKKEVDSLYIERDADKTSGYVHGDTADTTGLVLRAYYNDSSSSIVTPESITYSSGPYLKKGDLSYSVNYGGKSITAYIGTVKAKPATVTDVYALDRVYDATSEVTLSGGTLSGIIAGETVSFTLGTGTMADKNAGTGKAVATAIALTGADAGNYILNQPDDITVNIEKKEVKVTGLSAVNKVYDGNVMASVTDAGASFGGIVTGDSLSVSTTGTFSDAAVGSGKTVTFGELVLGGADSMNYKVKSDSQTAATASITEKGLTITGVTAAAREYDGTVSVELSGGTLAGAREGDEVGFTLGTGAMADKNAGTGKAVTTSITLTGAQAGNYALTQPDYVTVDISKKAVKVTGITAENKTYDQGTAAVLNCAGASFGGIIAGDSLSVSTTGTFSDAAAADDKTVTLGTLVLGGTDAGNYSVKSDSQTAATASITPAVVTITGVAAMDREYDGTKNVNLLGGIVLSGVLGGDTVYYSLGIGTVADGNADETNEKDVTTSITLIGAQAGNYVLTQPEGIKVKIKRKAVTVTGLSAIDKVYDGTVMASVTDAGASFGGIVAGDSLSVSTTGTFSDAAVGSGKTVTFGELVLGGADSMNYSVNPGSQTAAPASITPKEITVTGITAENKEYDKTDSATLSYASVQFDGKVTGDTLSVTAAGTFSDAKAGPGKTVSITGMTLGGTDAGNYSLGAGCQTETAADITRKTISSFTFGTCTKAFDETVTATDFSVTPASGQVIAGDDVSVSYISGTAAYSDPYVGTGKTVTVAKENVVLTGADSGCYQVSADIIRSDGAITVGSQSPTVLPVPSLAKGGNSVDLKPFLTGVMGGAAVTFSKGVGVSGASITSDGILTSGDTLGTYKADISIAAADVNGDHVNEVNSCVMLSAISVEIVEKLPAVINYSAPASKTYGDGSFTITASYEDGPESGGTWTWTADGTVFEIVSGGNTATALIKVKKAAATGGYVRAQYETATYLGYKQTEIPVDQAVLQIGGIKANNKVYDGTTGAVLDCSGAGFTGMADGDDLSVSTTGTFSGKDAGNNLIVSLGTLVLGGADAANYVIDHGMSQHATVASITPKPVTVTGVAATDREYDGSSAVAITGGAIAGKVAGDDVSLVLGTGLVTDTNAGTGKAVTTAITLAGADAGNYTVTQPDYVTVDIAKKEVTVSGITAESKTYDGTTDAAVTTSSAVFTGIISGDDLSVTATGTFSDANAADDKTVTLGTLVLGGTSAGNYSVKSGSQTTATASIAKKEITITGVSATGRAYDGTTDITLTCGGDLAGVLPADTAVTYSLGTGTASDRNVGTGKAVTTAITLTGTGSGNYELTQPDYVTVDIAKKEVTVSGITADDKTYDGTNSATLATGSASFTGLITGDDLTVSATGIFSDRNAGTGKTVTISAVSLGGTDAGNYSVKSDSQTTATAAIAQADVAVSGITADDKTYDGTTAAVTDASGAVFTGLIAGDDLTVSATGSFTDASAGTGKTVTLGTLVLGGTDAANYKVDTGASQTEATADITRAALTVTASGTVSKTYDGTAAWTGSKDLDLSGLVSSDSAGKITATAGTYNSKNVSEADKVTITAATPSGFDPDNYSYTLPQLTASISKLSVTVTVTGPSAKTYGESFEHAAYATLLGSDTSDYTVEYDGGPKPADAGTYAVTAAMSNGNYDPVTTPFSFVISPAEITTLHDAAVNIRAGDTSENAFPGSVFGTAPVSGTWSCYDIVCDPSSSIQTGYFIDYSNGKVYVQLSDTAAPGNKIIMKVRFYADGSNYANLVTLLLTVNVIDKEPVTPAVSMTGWTYGSAANSPSAVTGITDSYPATNPQTVFKYEGTGSTVYPESETVPSIPGTYMARAYYEDDNHKGTGSVDFTIAKKQLSWTGLTVSDKVYDGSADALPQLAGTLGIAGEVNAGEATAGTGAPASAAFADAYIGSGKNVTVVISGAVGGTHSEYYEAPSATLVLAGNIISPSEPIREADASSTTLTVSDIGATVITASMTDAGYGTADSVKAALAGKAGEDVGAVSSNAVYYNFDISGTTDSTIFVPYPAGTDASRTFAVAVMKADGTMEKISSSAMTGIPGGFRFTTSETGAMAVVVAWDVPAPAPAPAPSDRGGSSGAENPIVLGGNKVWSEARKQIAAASGKTTVTVDAGSSTAMPWDVMEALRQNPDVTLVIKRDGKADIVIPGGEALEHKAGTDSYSLDDLADTFGQGTDEYITGPYVFKAYSDQEPEEEVTEPVNEPAAEAPETPETEGAESGEGEETGVLTADAEGSAAASGEEEKKGIDPLVIALPAAAAVIGGTAILLRKKKE